MLSDRTITAGNHSYTIRFGQNALYLMEEFLAQLHQKGVLKPRKLSYKDEKSGATVEIDVPIGVEDLAQLPRSVGTQIGLWVSLEGARRKYKTRPQPFTLEEAGEIIDDAGGLTVVEPIVVEAFKAAFPQYFPQESEGNSAKPEGTSPEKNAPADPAPPIGTRRSAKPRKSESPPTTSGSPPPAN